MVGLVGNVDFSRLGITAMPARNTLGELAAGVTGLPGISLPFS